jgi:hypothetical protein
MGPREDVGSWILDLPQRRALPAFPCDHCWPWPASIAAADMAAPIPRQCVMSNVRFDIRDVRCEM